MPFAVSSVEGVGNLDGREVMTPQFQRLECYQVLQGWPSRKLHSNERLTLLLADVVDRANVGMRQRGGGFCLALETVQGQRITRNLIGQELQGNKAVQARVLSLIDHSHAAAAQLLDNAVVRDSLANHVVAVS